MGKYHMKMPDGKDVEFEEIDFDVDKEPWVIIDLNDGNRIRLKINITGVSKAIGVSDNGKPVYHIQHQQITAVELDRNRSGIR